MILNVGLFAYWTQTLWANFDEMTIESQICARVNIYMDTFLMRFLAK